VTSFFSAFDLVSIGVAVTDTSLRIRFWNTCLEDWTGRSRESVLGREIAEILPRLAEKQYQSRLGLLLESGAPLIFSHQLHGSLFTGRDPLRQERVQHTTVTSFKDPEDTPHLLFSVEDRTEVSLRTRSARQELELRVKTEKALRNALAEKDFLMREINHRVKNNLNMILSIINLQRSSADSEAFSHGLNDLEGRIRTFSSLHEALYRQDRADIIAMDDYLYRVCDDLFHSLRAPGSRARLICSLQPLELPPRLALHIALLTVEALTNSIKYGIAGRNDGTISVSLNVQDGGEARLVIEDDGPGFADPETPGGGSSLGMSLLGIFAEELGGRLTLENAPGARVSVQFSIGNGSNAE